jgi:UrcA family protein
MAAAWLLDAAHRTGAEIEDRRSLEVSIVIAPAQLEIEASPEVRILLGKRQQAPRQLPGERVMISVNRINTVSGRKPAILAAALFAVGALGLFSARAHAADFEQVTISAPSVKIIGHDGATGAPIEDKVQTALIKVDPVSLTTRSGVALLNDAVQDSAQKICFSLDPLNWDDGECVRGAVRSAQPQVTAAVTRAMATATAKN